MTTAAPSTDWVDFACIAFDVETREPAEIVVLDTEGKIAVELTPTLARDLARRLNDLADDFKHYKPLRRPAAVAERLRGLDD